MSHLRLDNVRRTADLLITMSEECLRGTRHAHKSELGLTLCQTLADLNGIEVEVLAAEALRQLRQTTAHDTPATLIQLFDEIVPDVHAIAA